MMIFEKKTVEKNCRKLYRKTVEWISEIKRSGLGITVRSRANGIPFSDQLQEISGIFPFARIPICSRITCKEFWIPILMFWSVWVLKTVSFDKKYSHFQSFCMIFLEIFPFARIPICSRITCNDFWGQIPICSNSHLLANVLYQFKKVRKFQNRCHFSKKGAGGELVSRGSRKSVYLSPQLSWGWKNISRSTLACWQRNGNIRITKEIARIRGDLCLWKKVAEQEFSIEKVFESMRDKNKSWDVLFRRGPKLDSIFNVLGGGQWFGVFILQNVTIPGLAHYWCILHEYR